MRDYLVYALYRAIGETTGRLPRRAGYWLADRVGWLLYVFSPQLRRILTHNIRHVVGPDADEAHVRDLARQACVNLAKGHYDLFRVGRLTDQQIEETMRIEGWEHLDNALSK